MANEKLKERNQLLLAQYANATKQRDELTKKEIIGELLLINDNLIRWFCNLMKKRGLLCTCFDYDDCYQTAVLGFMRAVKTYDASKGTLITYAYLWMRAYVNTAFKSAAYPVHVPAYIQKDVPIPEVLDIDSTLYLSDDDEEEIGLWETIVRHDNTDMGTSVSPEEFASHSNAIDTIKYVLSHTLSEREMKVICSYFGLDGEGEKSFDTVAREVMGATRERSRQVAARALRKLRQPSNAKRLRDLISIFDSGIDWSDTDCIILTEEDIYKLFN